MFGTPSSDDQPPTRTHLPKYTVRDHWQLSLFFATPHPAPQNLPSCNSLQHPCEDTRNIAFDVEMAALQSGASGEEAAGESVPVTAMDGPVTLIARSTASASLGPRYGAACPLLRFLVHLVILPGRCAVGGAFWSFLLLLPQLAIPVAVFVADMYRSASSSRDTPAATALSSSRAG
jgi:hypothetical protein